LDSGKDDGMIERQLAAVEQHTPVTSLQPSQHLAQPSDGTNSRVL